MKKTNPFLLFILCIFMLGDACKKQDTGFLSSNIYYIENPFSVSQGTTTTSSSIIADGSTNPLYVTLLKVKDEATGASADSLFLQPQHLYVYKDAITYNDSTPEALYNKLADSTVAPFSINEIGGRLQFTSTTTHIPQGAYNIDINVKNVRGNRLIENACTINILPSEFFILEQTPYTYLLDTTTQGRVYSTPEITATRDITAAPVITIKWVDADGKIFNPKAGEVLTRTGLANFQNWDPYYDVELTDTAFVYKYPDKVPMFPAFTTALVGAATQDGYWCYYKIPAAFVSETGQEARTGFTFKFPNAVGAYNVTIKVIAAHKKQ